MSDKLTSKDLRTGGSNSPQFTSIIDLRSSGVPVNEIPDRDWETSGKYLGP